LRIPQEDGLDIAHDLTLPSGRGPWLVNDRLLEMPVNPLRRPSSREMIDLKLQNSNLATSVLQNIPSQVCEGESCYHKALRARINTQTSMLKLICSILCMRFSVLTRVGINHSESHTMKQNCNLATPVSQSVPSQVCEGESYLRTVRMHHASVLIRCHLVYSETLF